ncbi:DUF1552 domain-containing protein [Sorangium sp. So ce887]|uniref:DUF1552 domain-containing protein n=1 Tax=Sorangium sp. So ce887 TaxID=3133324 RepID=UPI003F63CDA2
MHGITAGLRLAVAGCLLSLSCTVDSLREIEKNVARVQSTIPANLGCAPRGAPGMVPEPPGPQEGLNENDSTEAGEYRHDDHANVMMDLLVMAIQCDVTRVVTHMLDDARSEFAISGASRTGCSRRSCGSRTAADALARARWLSGRGRQATQRPRGATRRTARRSSARSGSCSRSGWSA